MDDTAPKPFVLVLMPFDTAFDDIYQLGIKETCKTAGAYAERVDEQKYDGSVLQRIYNQVAKADLIVADMSDRNPNVYYEVGYAHALGKRVILLTKNADDIPFDLKDQPHIVYGSSIQRLREQLGNWIVWALENPKADLVRLSPPIQFYINRLPLKDNPQITYPCSGTITNLRLLVDAYNSAERGIRSVTFRLSLLSSDLFTCSGEGRELTKVAVRLPAGGRMHVFDKEYHILPGGWESFIKFDLQPSTRPLKVGSEHEFVLRLLTEGEPCDFPFRVLLTEG